MDLEAIRICAALAWADGTIAGDEAETLRRMIQRAKLGADDQRAAFGFLSRRVTLADAGATVAPENASAVYLAAAALASSDGELHPDERAFLDRLRQRLSIDEETAQRLEVRALHR